MKDAQTYADWTVDYLKYDNCYNEGVDGKMRYTAMSDAIAATGRSIFYSICNWGNDNISQWGSSIAQSWRTTQDIAIYNSPSNQWQQLKANFLQNMMSADQAGAGGWNDPDMLQVGNNLLTIEEEKTHFALWAYSKAPLIIGANLDKFDTMHPESLAILKNEALIKINQDRLGNQAKCVQGCDPKAPSSLHVYQSLVYPNDHDGLQMAVLGVNWDDAQTQNLVVNLANVGIASTQFDNCKMTDLYTGVVTGVIGGD